MCWSNNRVRGEKMGRRYLRKRSVRGLRGVGWGKSFKKQNPGLTGLPGIKHLSYMLRNSRPSDERSVTAKPELAEILKMSNRGETMDASLPCASSDEAQRMSRTGRGAKGCQIAWRVCGKVVVGSRAEAGCVLRGGGGGPHCRGEEIWEKNSPTGKERSSNWARGGSSKTAAKSLG